MTEFLRRCCNRKWLRASVEISLRQVGALKSVSQLFPLLPHSVPLTRQCVCARGLGGWVAIGGGEVGRLSGMVWVEWGVDQGNHLLDSCARQLAAHWRRPRAAPRLTTYLAGGGTRLIFRPISPRLNPIWRYLNFMQCNLCFPNYKIARGFVQMQHIWWFGPAIRREGKRRVVGAAWWPGGALCWENQRVPANRQ